MELGAILLGLELFLIQLNPLSHLSFQNDEQLIIILLIISILQPNNILLK